MTRPEAALIDELEFRSYVHNRKQFPDVSPGRWAAIFSNVLAMEERLSTGNILDVAPQGEKDSRSERSPYQALNTEKGVSGTMEGHGINKSGIAPILGQSGQSENQASPADSRISTPLYLLASEIVGVVTKGYEQ